MGDGGTTKAGNMVARGGRSTDRRWLLRGRIVRGESCNRRAKCTRGVHFVVELLPTCSICCRVHALYTRWVQRNVFRRERAYVFLITHPQAFAFRLRFFAVLADYGRRGLDMAVAVVTLPDKTQVLRVALFWRAQVCTLRTVEVAPAP